MTSILSDDKNAPPPLFPLSLCDERKPFHVTFSGGRPDGGGGGSGVVSRQNFRQRIALDTAFYGMFAEVIVEDASGVRDSLSFGINFRSQRDQQWWFHTPRQGEGSLVPGALVAGSVGEPMIWDAPKILRRGETLELEIAGDDGLAGFVDICRFNITLLGARLDVDNAGQAVRDPLMAWDRRDVGYTSIVFDYLNCERSGQRCFPGPEVSTSIAIGQLPYDLLVSEGSLIVVEPGTKYTPVSDVRGELRLRDTSFTHDLVGNNGFIPFSYFGGQTKSATALAQLVRPMASPLGSRWRLRQDSTIELFARSIDSPTLESFNVMMALHGQRTRVYGRPQTAKELANRPCPPDGYDYPKGPWAQNRQIIEDHPRNNGHDPRSFNRLPPQ